MSHAMTPALQADVLHLCRVARKDLNTRTRERRCREIRRSVFLDNADTAALLSDDEQAREYCKSFFRDAVRDTNRLLHAHAARHLKEQSTRPQRGVEPREL